MYVHCMLKLANIYRAVTMSFVTLISMVYRFTLEKASTDQSNMSRGPLQYRSTPLFSLGLQVCTLGSSLLSDLHAFC